MVITAKPIGSFLFHNRVQGPAFLTINLVFAAQAIKTVASIDRLHDLDRKACNFSGSY